jgi:uncharacterized protein
MLLVPCIITFSSIHGLGLFARDKICRGTMIWKFEPGVDQIFTHDDIEKLDEEQRLILEQYAYLTRDKEWILCGDISMFANHSELPNTFSTYNLSKYGEDYAACDIAAGEEITWNYSEWDEDFLHKLSLNRANDYARILEIC